MDELILMKPNAVYLRMCMKEDNPGLKNVKGDNYLCKTELTHSSSLYRLYLVYHVNGLFVLCEWHKYQQFENMIVKQRGKCHNFLTKLSFQVAARNVWHVLKNGLKQSSTLTASKRGNVSINLFPKSALQADFKPIKAI